MASNLEFEYRGSELNLAARMRNVSGSVIDEIDARAAGYGADLVSLAGGTTAQTDFPAEALREIAADVLASEGGAALRYGHSLGESALIVDFFTCLKQKGCQPIEVT